MTDHDPTGGERTTPSPDFERTVRRALDAHARRIEQPTGRLADVWAHVDRRRDRRRMVAAAGSTAVVVAGIGGLLALRTGADAPASAPSATSEPVISSDTAFWRCSGDLGRDETFTYFQSCDQVPAGTPVTLLPAPQPAPTAPPTTAPTTGVSPEFTMPPGVPVTTLPVAVTEQVYTVVPGDSVYGIAARYWVDPAALANYNAWPEGIDHPLQVGDEVKIPPGAVVPDGFDVCTGGKPPVGTTIPGCVPAAIVPTTTAPPG